MLLSEAARILVIGINYAPEEVGIGPYTTGMVGALVEAGHAVEVVTAKPYYPRWRIPADYRGGVWRRSVEHGATITRCPLYVPHDPGGMRRIVHHASFALAAAAPVMEAAWRRPPDLVLTVAPSLLTAPLAKLAARVSGARSWLHIQDFEIEAAFATGLIRGSGKTARTALGFQARAIAGFDAYSSISPQMCARLIAMGVSPERVHEFRNWSDIDRVRPLAGPSPLRAAWGITAPAVALYSGNISRKQGIGIIVDAAERLRARDDIQFVVCGEGPHQTELVQRAAHLPNIQFRPLQPAARLSELLGLASIHLLPQLAGAADLVLPSKLTNMLASGRPVVVTADAGSGLASEAEGCGLIVAPGSPGALADAVAALADDPDQAARLGAAARARAERRWSRDMILSGFVRRVEALCAGGRAQPLTTRGTASRAG